MKSKFQKIIRSVYLYTFAAVGLIFLIVGATTLVNVGLKTYVFPLEHYANYWEDSRCSYYEVDTSEYEECVITEDSDARKRDLAIGVANFVVGTPLWLYHWGTIQRRKKED